jgi:hypothetical protein
MLPERVHEAEVLRIKHDRMNGILREALNIAATLLFRDTFLNEL